MHSQKLNISYIKKWSSKHRKEDEARLLTSSILLLDSILLLSIIIYYKLVLYLLKKSSVIATSGIPQFIKCFLIKALFVDSLLSFKV